MDMQSFQSLPHDPSRISCSIDNEWMDGNWQSELLSLLFIRLKEALSDRDSWDLCMCCCLVRLASIFDPDIVFSKHTEPSLEQDKTKETVKYATNPYFYKKFDIE